jgi:hypothetical protein
LWWRCAPACLCLSVTKADVERAVQAVWRTLSPDTLGRVAAPVRRNLVSVIAVDGGNFYREGQGPICERPAKRARTR